MGVETRVQTCDVQCVRCDASNESEQCGQETMALQSVDSVVVVLDPSWLTLLWGVDEARFFCSWDHLAAWSAAENLESGGDGFAARVRGQSRANSSAPFKTR